jgi:hypothetical protein
VCPLWVTTPLQTVILPVYCVYVYCVYVYVYDDEYEYVYVCMYVYVYVYYVYYVYVSSVRNHSSTDCNSTWISVRIIGVVSVVSLYNCVYYCDTYSSSCVLCEEPLLYRL